MDDDCKDCKDETHPKKWAHYTYLDNKEPQWTCFEHPDYTRKRVGILSPKWVENLTCVPSEDK